MNSLFKVIILHLILLFSACYYTSETPSSFFIPTEISRDGKIKTDKILDGVYTKMSNTQLLPIPTINREMLQSVRLQKKLLEVKRRGKKNFNINGLKFNKTDLERTSESLEHWCSSALVPPSEYFDLYQISGADKKGNVKFTGYYSPVLQVSQEKEGQFQYPIYGKPQGEGPFPTRREIYQEGALEGNDLELAYARSLLDIQKMQLQGSGYVQYRDGKLVLFSYGGSNGHPRKSIQRYFLNNYGEKGQGITLEKLEKYFDKNPEYADEIIFHNPSYVFFVKNEKRKTVNGSGNVPLQPTISIATDKRYIPTGACLLAEKPIPNKKRVEHQPSILLAQDVGGGIKGPGHIDLYTGIGKEGRRNAALGHYGRLWLLLAK